MQATMQKRGPEHTRTLVPPSRSNGRNERQANVAVKRITESDAVAMQDWQASPPRRLLYVGVLLHMGRCARCSMSQTGQTQLRHALTVH